MTTRTSSFIDRVNSSFGCVALLCVATVLGGVLFPVREASAQTTVAGFTPGSFQVGPSGAATYTIPIQVPPGVAGMEPKLALSYNSQGGNGLLGMGWSLSGLSAITRCPQTVAQDGPQGGFVGGVNYNERDRYCLDGQRLVLVTGASYGADGAEYRTERESFTKIISYGAPGNGPTYVGPNFFKVWTKSGQIMEYGNSADSRIEASGKSVARVWAVNKISDTKGNYLTATYAEDTSNGDFYPTRIDYNYTGTPAIPNASVQFSYQPRTDVSPAYVSGSIIKTLNRLTNVKTYVGMILVKDYRLNYVVGGATGNSRLIGLVECDAASNCLSAKQFSWSDSVLGFGFNRSLPGASTATNSYIDSINGIILTGDWNGDGKTDFLHLHPNADPQYSWVALSSGAMPDRLNTIDNGLGANILISYKPLTNSTVYVKDTSPYASSYPLIDLQNPLYVVSSVSSSNGLSGTLTTNYKYGGLKSDLNGRGSLGFRWTETTQADGLTTRIESRQDWPYTGLPSLTQKKVPSGGNAGVVNTASYAHSCINPTTGSACIVALGNRYFPFVSQSVESAFDLNGAVLPTVTTTTGYDAYGNATSILVSTGDGFSKTTTNTYTNDTANWFLGRLTRSQVTSTTP